MKTKTRNLLYDMMGMLLVALAAMLGADGSFAMAIADSAQVAETSEQTVEAVLQQDEQGVETQLQNRSATATDVRDAGLEAEDYDEKIVMFKKFKFPIETYIATKCRPIKAKNYIHLHARAGSTDLNAIYNGDAISLAAGAREFTASVADFSNPECMIPFSTVTVENVSGYTKDINNNEVQGGQLALFVKSNNINDSGIIKFYVLNGSATQSITIDPSSTFITGATACSESQMKVAPETFVPERYEVFLQKKIATCVITDEFAEQDKKVAFLKKDVLQNAMYNFKRKCARTHWIGTKNRFKVNVEELGGQPEDVFCEEGIIPQIPMLYTHGEDLEFDDLMAINALQFGDNTASDTATAFCGKREMRRIMKLANSAEKYKDIRTVEVNTMGIRVRNWEDNFGRMEFVYDPTLDDIGYENFMVVVDLANAVRYYKRDEKQQTQDMKETAEYREAERTMISRIDCIALRGYNAVLVCPSDYIAANPAKLGSISSTFTTTADLATVTDHSKKYYLTADSGEFQQGTIVTWDSDLEQWVEYDGYVA